MEFFVRGLSLPGLKQKARQFLNENPPATWQQLKDHITTKDLGFAVSSEFTATSSSSVDSKLKIERIKDQLKELTGLMKDHKINTSCNPNESEKEHRLNLMKHYSKKLISFKIILFVLSATFFALIVDDFEN